MERIARLNNQLYWTDDLTAKSRFCKGLSQVQQGYFAILDWLVNFSKYIVGEKKFLDYSL
jgi:hypothetical protein